MAERERDDEMGLDEQLLAQTLPVGPGVPLDEPGMPAMPAPSGREQRDALTWGDKGQMSGFAVGSDYGGDTKARNSMKNTFGRLASQFGASTPDAVRQLVQTEEFRRYFPNARLLDHASDPKIDFGGQLSDFESGTPVGVVDVLAASGQNGWQWLDEANSGGMGGAPMGGSVDDLMNADLSGIMQQAQALTEGEDIDPLLLQQILGQEMR